jgi:hypothetical protein
VIEHSGQNGAIAHALERVLGRRIEQPARLGIAERGRRAFVGLRSRTLDAVDGIVGYGVMLAEVVE